MAAGSFLGARGVSKGRMFGKTLCRAIRGSASITGAVKEEFSQQVSVSLCLAPSRSVGKVDSQGQSTHLKALRLNLRLRPDKSLPDSAKSS